MAKEPTPPYINSKRKAMINIKLTQSSMTALGMILLITLFGTHIASADESATSESIGYYTAGCIRNAQYLPKDGEGYQVIRLSRGRYFANPAMVDYITWLSNRVKGDLGGMLLIADISQQKGGPILDDHSSHQIGLDADILFWQHPVAKTRSLTIAEREPISPRTILTWDKRQIDESRWETIHGEMLKIAASNDRVERIFINPVIKKRLCAIYNDEPWLAKLRPWYGHDGHFHVRLKCPATDSMCEPQKPSDLSGNGCGSDLHSWFRSDGTVKKKRTGGTSVQRPLPPQCQNIVNGYTRP